jgi:hypothetical protein
MARYIDADRLLTKIHELYVQPNIELWQVVNCVYNSPTADVVPKSEVEGLRNDIDISYEYGKIDAAREIFEEIEKILIDSAYIPDCARFVDIDKLAELRKKYTGKIK